MPHHVLRCLPSARRLLLAAVFLVLPPAVVRSASAPARAASIASPFAAEAVPSGRWTEYELLQVTEPVAACDAAHDRLRSIGGSRGLGWALPLGAPPVWQELPRSSGPVYGFVPTGCWDPAAARLDYVEGNTLGAGAHTVSHAGANLPAALYFACLSQGGLARTARLVLVR